MVSIKHIRFGLVSLFLVFVILGCVLAANESEVLRIQQLYSSVAKALDESETAVILLDKHQVIGWNEGAKKLFEVDKDTALQKDIADFIENGAEYVQTFVPKEAGTTALFCKIKTASGTKNAIMFLKSIPNKEDAYMLIIASGVSEENIACMTN